MLLLDVVSIIVSLRVHNKGYSYKGSMWMGYSKVNKGYSKGYSYKGIDHNPSTLKGSDRRKIEFSLLNP